LANENLLKTYLSSLYLNLSFTYNDYEIIKDNAKMLNAHISTAEAVINFITGLHASLNFLTPLLSLMSDAKNDIDGICAQLENLEFDNINTENIDNYTLDKIFKEIGNYLASFLIKTKAKENLLTLNTIEQFSPTPDMDNWLKTARKRIIECQNKIAGYLNNRGINMVLKLIPPELALEDDSKKISIAAFPPKLIFSHVIFSDSPLKIELEGNLFGDSRNISAGVSINQLKAGNMVANVGSVFNISNEDTNMHIDISTLLKLTDHSNIDFEARFPFSMSNCLFDFELFRMGFIIRWRL
jgi:hypothetical protein